jgi:FkbM family methyltransferase
MSRIFLDVGGHEGQTVELLLQPRFKIDHIFTFEPSPVCLKILHRKFDNNPKVTVCGFGLFSKTCDMILHNSGSQGGTIWDDYQTTCNPQKKDDLCYFVEASEWFRNNISKEDEVFLKLNCEGSECSIVTNLLDSGEYNKVKAVLIDFDVRKSPTAKHQEDELRERLKAEGISNLHIYAGDYRHMLLPSVLR